MDKRWITLFINRNILILVKLHSLALTNILRQNTAYQQRICASIVSRETIFSYLKYSFQIFGSKRKKQRILALIFNQLRAITQNVSRETF